MLCVGDNEDLGAEIMSQQKKFRKLYTNEVPNAIQSFTRQILTNDH